MGGLLQVNYQLATGTIYVYCHLTCWTLNNLCLPLQTTISVIGTLGGPLLGLFSLGILFPSANSKVSVIIAAFNLQIVVGRTILLDPERICEDLESKR